MNESVYLLLGTGLTVAGGFVATAWSQRRRSPQSQTMLMGASDLLLTQMQTRLVALEHRVEVLEKENDSYHRLYGPLPAE